MSVAEGIATADDRAALRDVIALSQQATKRGELPFGARVIDPEGGVLAEAISTEISTGDWTCHAEINAVRLLADVGPDVLADTTLYASAEPCAMCAAATFYAGIRRIVFGISQPKLANFLATLPETEGLAWQSREILATAHIAEGTMTVIGPLEEALAIAPHEAFWRARR